MWAILAATIIVVATTGALAAPPVPAIPEGMKMPAPEGSRFCGTWGPATLKYNNLEVREIKIIVGGDKVLFGCGDALLASPKPEGFWSQTKATFSDDGQRRTMSIMVPYLGKYEFWFDGPTLIGRNARVAYVKLHRSGS
jgi:hypothetical protein